MPNRSEQTIISVEIERLRVARDRHMDKMYAAGVAQNRSAFNFHLDRFFECATDILTLRRLTEMLDRAPPYA